ncbi:morphogenetic protein [Yersinia enterocolitica]|uniref:morphogenetic protein n=1 Tax=Yersinia enterocolitica TaxID=630 RepID=UPI0038B975FE
MNEKPILFNSEMVNAILSGRKTQTRRIMRDQPEVIPPEDECGVPGYWIPYNAGKTMVRNEMMTIACPLGNPGDQLWVRETWARYNIDQASHDMAYRATTPADWPKDGLWRPSIHMPRWASRINLLITGVRVERLNDISEQDAISEGLECYVDDGVPYYGPFNNGDCRPDVVFRGLWDSIYGQKEGENWQANPWVWVINFERMEAK